MNTHDHPLGLSGRITRYLLRSHLTPLFAVVGLLLGLFASIITSREAELQIEVTFAHVVIGCPGSSVVDVEHLPAKQVLSQLGCMACTRCARH